MPPVPTTKCPKCSYRWLARVDYPKRCPRCQHKLNELALTKKGA
jgi:predicted Zn-ribbon and HTH transcriptional regulator